MGEWDTAYSAITTPAAGDDFLVRQVSATPPAGGTLRRVTLANLAAAVAGSAADYAPTGLTGAVAASRYAGATASGAPASGTFAVGDFVVDRSGTIWICTAAGTPGTWTSLVNTTGTQTVAGAKTFTGATVFEVSAGSNGWLVSTDGTSTSDGAAWAVPGPNGGLFMRNANEGVTYAWSADVGLSATAPPIFAGFQGGWLYFSQHSNTGAAVVTFANSSASGPGLGQACLTGYDNNHLVTFNSTLDDGSGGMAPAGTLTLAAGTTSLAPQEYRSGSLLTTATAGAKEFDGTCFYGTAAASSRQVIDSEQFTCLSAAYTLTNSTSAQKLFNATANGALTVQGSTTYYFECEFDLTSLSASSHTLSFGLGGTATLTGIKYKIESNTGAAGTLAAWQAAIVTTGAATAFTAAVTTTTAQAIMRGVMRVNAGGTIIPQVTQGTNAAAAVVSANSWFRCWPLGSGSVASVGNWS